MAFSFHDRTALVLAAATWIAHCLVAQRGERAAVDAPHQEPR